jgi:3-oxoacid CoA-transferase subunit A
VFVQRVVPLTPQQAADKRIEKRTVRPRPDRSVVEPVETTGGN